MKKGYIIGMVLAVLVITIGIFALPNSKNVNKSMNSGEIITKIETATKAIDTYYGEIKITGAVGDKKGSYLIKQWYKKDKLYSENYSYIGSEKKQKLQKTTISLKDNNQTTIYNIDTKSAIVTNTSTDKTFISQDSNFLQFTLDTIKNNTPSKVSLNNNEYIFDITKGDYHYIVKYNKNNLMPIKLDINYSGKFLSAIEFKGLNVNPEIKDKQLTITIPSDTKILKRNYSNENSDLTKIRSQVKYPVLLPSFLPKGIVLDKVTKEVIDTAEIVNIIYKGDKKINVIESTVNKSNFKGTTPDIKKVTIGKYHGYQSINGKNICLSWEQGKTAITIYSELDNSTLMKIAASFK